MPAAHPLLETIVDYAGLYPPADLDMRTAVANYARYRQQEHAWMLAAFVVGATRLDEFEREAESHLPAEGEGWELSVLLGPDRGADLERVERFREAHGPASDRGRARVVAIETKPRSREEIAGLGAAVPGDVELFLEIGWDDDPGPWIDAVAGVAARAKIRTGGVETGLFPSVEQLARFLEACRGHGVAFKATAGLHHPLRGEHPLSYEPRSPRGVMHGFLNVFAAGAFLHAGVVGGEQLCRLLEVSDPTELSLAGGGLRWGDLSLDAEALRSARRVFARSFGSCSFTEPVEDLETAEIP